MQQVEFETVPPRSDERTHGERRAIDRATHLTYRADIDGLRALAIVPVVLNHAGVRGVWGGFVGVDIFFVISGFLITGILARDIEIGHHSTAEFYRRRILRIFPALFAMLAVVTAFACATMLPSELLRYARALAATTLFGSNFVFYGESGYFEPAAHIKPLLHTWSLAIEEQFYIVWPLVLAAIGAGRPALQRATVLAVTIVSFGVAVWMVQTDMSAAFYLLPARAWELSLGAMIALGRSHIRRQWLAELLGAVGLMLILVAMKFYTEATPFPGATAALPCLGAALLLLTGASGTWVSRLFTLAPIVFLGQISYSLYLWHWPVIVFAEIGLFLPKTAPVIAAEVAIGLVLATVSWRYVERPFRSGTSGWPTRGVIGAGLAAMAAALAIAGLLWASGGLAGRFTPAERRIAAFDSYDGDATYRGGTCFVAGEGEHFAAARCLPDARPGRPLVLLLGDSHAAHFWPGLATLQDRATIAQATHTGCRPLLDPKARAGACSAFFAEMLTRWAPTHRPAVTLLAGRWNRGDLPLIEPTLRDARVRASHPVLVGPVPQYTTGLPRLLVYASRRGRPDLPKRALADDLFALDREMRAIAARTGTPYISMMDLLCRDGRCRTLAADGVLMQFDYGHLTVPGSIVAVRALWPALRAEAGFR